MNVYAIQNDDYRYKTVDLEVDDILDFYEDKESDLQIYEFSRNNLSLVEQWQRIQTGWFEIEDGENITPDISTWIDATLFLSPKAYRFLFDMLQPFGEFLPVHMNNEVFFIFNCLTLAQEDSQKTTDTEISFSKHEIENKIVFKNKTQFCIDTFCTDIFKNSVEEFELKGLKFSQKLEIP